MRGANRRFVYLLNGSCDGDYDQHWQNKTAQQESREAAERLNSFFHGLSVVIRVAAGL